MSLTAVQTLPRDCHWPGLVVLWRKRCHDDAVDAADVVVHPTRAATTQQLKREREWFLKAYDWVFVNAMASLEEELTRCGWRPSSARLAYASNLRYKPMMNATRDVNPTSGNASADIWGVASGVRLLGGGFWGVAFYVRASGAPLSLQSCWWRAVQSG